MFTAVIKIWDRSVPLIPEEGFDFSVAGSVSCAVSRPDPEFFDVFFVGF